MAALLDMPETMPTATMPTDKAPRTRKTSDARRAAAEPLPVRRERPGLSGDPYADDDSREYARSRGRGRRIRRGLIPQSKNGRIAAGLGVLAVLGGMAAAAYAGMHYLHHDAQFTIPSSAAIELQGNQHLSRAQLLSIFGEDVDGNIFNVPLADRRDALEQLPWVEHATVMRLLPNRLRVAVVERTPIAFVRQGGNIGMADANGVLLDIPPDAPGNPNYSFPVVTGLKAEDTPESRAQRMHLYAAFLKDLDSGPKKLSPELSEIDLSNPEDVKALLPSNNTETLVHFGTGNFLARYNRFAEHIAEWRQQYPRLNSVDMRYDRQVVLQMPPKDSTVASTAGDAKASTTAPPVAGRAPVSSVHSAAVAPVPRAAMVEHHSAAPVTQDASIAKHRGKPAVARRTANREADMAKRVAAIKQWMARRQQKRDAARSR